MSLHIGVMSGTSLDGIDVAIVNIDENGLSLVAAETTPFQADLHRVLLDLIESGYSTLSVLGQTDIKLGYAYSDAINQLLTKTQLQPEQIQTIGCHGQTIYHAPDAEYPFSMQIGNANVIAEQTGITTITDFRQRDMVLGGQGAPLVPAFHHSLFGGTHSDRVIANIGGISNITILPSDISSSIIGFDTGPGNGLMDQWFQQSHSGHYDQGGRWAQSGSVHSELLKLCLADPYFTLSAPKSTGREHFNLAWLKNKLSQIGQDIKAEDVQRTLLSLTVITLTDAIKQYASASNEIYICGGGAHNTFLMEALTKALHPKLVNTTSSIGLAPDWVEACAFAWLGKQTIEHKPGNLPAVTGASQPTILGAIYSSNDASYAS